MIIKCNVYSFSQQIIKKYHGQIETLKESHAVKIAEIKRLAIGRFSSLGISHSPPPPSLLLSSLFSPLPFPSPDP